MLGRIGRHAVGLARGSLAGSGPARFPAAFRTLVSRPSSLRAENAVTARGGGRGARKFNANFFSASFASAAVRKGRLSQLYENLDFGTVIMNLGAVSGLCGFMMSDVLYLRMLSICGSLCGITYNITRTPRQINACLWGAVFISTNAFMIVQLIRERNQEGPQFTFNELELWQRHFSDHGVDHKTFKRLMDHAKWETKRLGDVIVPAGKPLERVILIHDGLATAFKEGVGKHGLRWAKKMYEYEGRGRNGCIIGGTALVDPNTTRHP